MNDSRYPITAVTFLVFADFLGYGILIPIIPLYAEHFGAGEFTIGLLIAVYALMQFLFAPVLGRLSDAYGRRPILLVSIAGNVAAYVCFGLAGSILGLFAARVLSGAMAGNVAVAQAYVTDVLEPEDRAKGFGVLGAAFGLGLVFGPALGGVLSRPDMVATASDLLPVFAPYLTQFSIPAFATAAIAGANLAFAAVFLPKTGGDEGTNRDTGFLNIGRLIENRFLLGLVASYSIRSLAYSSMVSMFVVFTADIYGYGTTMNGYILAFIGILVSFNQGLVVDKVIDRTRELRVISVGASVESVCLVLVPFSPLVGAIFLPESSFGQASWLTPQLGALLIIVSVLATGDAFTTVSINTLISKISTENRQGENLGFAQSGDGLARATGPIIAGGLYSTFGYWVPFVVGGIIMILVAGTAIFLSSLSLAEFDRKNSS